MRRVVVALLAGALGAAAPAPATKPAVRFADLVVRNAHVYTVDARSNRVDAFAVRAGRFVAVGSDTDVARYVGPHTVVRDAHGATIVPGLIDAHAHLYEIGEYARSIDLRGSTTYATVIDRVRAGIGRFPADGWAFGGGWDQNLWPDKAFPTHGALDAAVGDRPVALERVDGHALLADAAAMRAAGVDAATPDPAGGRIVRDASGAPTGVFMDNAMALVQKHEPPPTTAEMNDVLRSALRICRNAGLVEVQDMGSPRRVIERFADLAAHDDLAVRVYSMVGDDPESLAWAYARGPQSGLDGGRLWIRGIKMYADGALGSRGAALLAPYSDDPGNVGLLVSSREHLRDGAVAALRHGFQVSTHAIGDRGNRNVLDAYEYALHAVPTRDARLRVEHAQVVAPDDIPRFAKLGIIPSMQATHATSDMAWAQDRLGSERIKGAYAWQTFLKSGVVIPDGTDAPVEGIDPLHTFYSAVTRQDPSGMPAGGWRPEERMTRDQALRSMTIWAAYAGFQDRVGGSIEVGKRADFDILDRDIMTVPTGAILGTHVVATYVSGDSGQPPR